MITDSSAPTPKTDTIVITRITTTTTTTTTAAAAAAVVYYHTHATTICGLSNNPLPPCLDYPLRHSSLSGARKPPSLSPWAMTLASPLDGAPMPMPLNPLRMSLLKW